MSILLDWVVEDGGINNQADWTKAELLLLSSKLNYTLPNINLITFSDKLCQGLAHALFPSTFVKPLEEELSGFEAPFVKKVLEYVPQEGKPTYSKENILLGVHEVYFDTVFGDIPRVDSQYCDWIIAESKINHWSGQDSASAYFTYLDLIAECGLALKYLGQDLEQDEILLLNTLTDITPSWSTYHPFLVKELYEVA